MRACVRECVWGGGCVRMWVCGCVVGYTCVGVWEGIHVCACEGVRACLHVFKVKCPPLFSRLLFCFLNRSIHICCLKVTATQSPR